MLWYCQDDAVVTFVRRVAAENWRFLRPSSQTTLDSDAFSIDFWLSFSLAACLQMYHDVSVRVSPAKLTSRAVSFSRRVFMLCHFL